MDGQFFQIGWLPSIVLKVPQATWLVPFRRVFWMSGSLVMPDLSFIFRKLQSQNFQMPSGNKIEVSLLSLFIHVSFPLIYKVLHILTHSIVTIFFHMKTFDAQLSISNALIQGQITLESFLGLRLRAFLWTVMGGHNFWPLGPQTMATVSVRILSHKSGASRQNMFTACHQAAFHTKLTCKMKRVCQATRWQKSHI